MPNKAANPFVHDGGVHQSGLVSDMLSCLEQNLFVNTAVVSLTNPTVATDMMTFTLPAPDGAQGAVLNAAGKVLQLTAYGTYNVAAASTVVFTIKLGGATLATFTTASQATTAVTLNWQIYLVSATVTAGAAGTAECHGELNFDSGATLAAACSAFCDSNVAAITGINFTGPLLLEVMANFGTGNASSVIAERFLEVEIYG